VSVAPREGHALDLYFYPSPNGLKITIMLEECGLPYRIHFVDITRGAQFEPAFLRISPNNKIPALVAEEPGLGPLSLFESGAILLYLAERTSRFLPPDVAGRHRCLMWLFWQVGGLGPMAGQAHHFRAFASESVPYAVRRYTDEVNRLYGVLDRALANSEWVAGGYSIADMACYPWIMPHERQGQRLEDFPSLKRWFEAMSARPAVQRGLAHGHERHADDIGHTFLYGQTAAKVTAQERDRSESPP
jgi:GSH-dependent disulfide-bond oxidoreductase